MNGKLLICLGILCLGLAFTAEANAQLFSRLRGGGGNCNSGGCSTSGCNVDQRSQNTAVPVDAAVEEADASISQSGQKANVRRPRSSISLAVSKARLDQKREALIAMTSRGNREGLPDLKSQQQYVQLLPDLKGSQVASMSLPDLSGMVASR